MGNYIAILESCYYADVKFELIFLIEVAKIFLFCFNANMKVSFKGINNIYIFQGKKQDVPLDIENNDGELCKGTANIDNTRFRCILDDDETTDLNDYYIALAKYKDKNKYLLHADSYDSIDLSFNDVDVDILGYKQNLKMLMLNGQELNIEDNSILPLYTFLASLTKRISDYENIDPRAKSLFLKIDSAIYKKACEYLDIEV